MFLVSNFQSKIWMVRVLTGIGLFLLCSTLSHAQIASVSVRALLPAALSESSGGVFFNGRFISHNDSGNENRLYEVDTATGLILRTVHIQNAVNSDWEDLAQDATSLYIGDIGNNRGSRTDLKIYKIAKSDYLVSDTVLAEIIHYSYADQIDFTPNLNKTEWDAEALLSLDSSSLLLLTKDWVNRSTKAYSVPKQSGTYALQPMPSQLNNAGLITGGIYDSLSGRMVLTGYNRTLMPLIWVCHSFSHQDVFSGSNQKSFLVNLMLEQTEAIAQTGPLDFLISSESFDQGPFKDDAKLIDLQLSAGLDLIADAEIPSVRIYPNPVSNLLFIDGGSPSRVELLDMRSVRIYQGGSERMIDLSHLRKGVYLLRITGSDGNFTQELLIKD